MMKEAKTWTQEMRSFQAAILNEALPLDRKATAEIEQASALIEK